MSKRTELQNDSIRIRFTEDPLPGKPIVLTREVLRDLPPKLKCIQAMSDAHGTQLSPPYLCGGTIVLDILPGSANLVHVPPEQILEDLHRTHEEIRRNANSSQPKPHTVAVTTCEQLPILRALRNAFADQKDPPVITIKGTDNPLPIPNAADFTEPSPDNLHQKTDRFRIVGLRRDDVRGHRLLITRDDLTVHLPTDDPKWSWSTIRDVLDGEAWLQGTIQRPGRGSHWCVCAGTTIIRQDPLFGDT